MSNRISVQGRLPENHSEKAKMTFAKNGSAKYSFLLMDSRNTAPKGQDAVFVTQFWNVEIWGTKAEQASAALAGKMSIRVEGAVEQGEYEKDDGSKIRTLKLVAFSIQQAVGKDANNANIYQEFPENDL